MTAVIRCLALATGQGGPAGQWLCGYDPETGVSDWSSNREDALVFAGAGEAYAFWTQVHPTDPVRWDGRPNRPLTAFTVEVIAE